MQKCALRHTGSKTPGGAGTHTRQTQEPHKPTSKPTPPTDSRARPHPNPGTHASPHTTPLTRKRGGGDGDGDGARTWEQRGREPDGIGDGTPPRTGRHGGKRLRHPRAADRAHGSCPAARTGHDYARCAAREAEDRRPHGVAARPADRRASQAEPLGPMSVACTLCKARRHMR